MGTVDKGIGLNGRQELQKFTPLDPRHSTMHKLSSIMMLLGSRPEQPL